MPYPTLGATTLPPGEDAVTAANNPWFTLAVQLGAEPDTAAGYDDFDAAHQSFPTGGRRAVLLANPELAAVIASGMAAALANVGAFGQALPASQQPSAATIIAKMLQMTATPDQVYGVWSDLPTAARARYAAAVQQAVPALVGVVAAGNPNTSTPAYTYDLAYNAALRSGPVVNYTIDGVTYTVPASYVVEGPVVLPDGMAYIVINHWDGPHATFWQTPAFVPLQHQNVFVRPDSCEPVVPGTGEWYVKAAFTGDTGPCSGVPAGWTQGFGLVSARARQSLSFEAPRPLIVADGTTVAPTTAPGASPAMSVDANGNPINGPAPAAVPVVPVVATQDQRGNLLPAASVAPSPVEVNLLPAGVSAPTLAGLQAISPIVLVGGAVLVGLLLYSSSRRR